MSFLKIVRERSGLSRKEVCREFDKLLIGGRRVKMIVQRLYDYENKKRIPRDEVISGLSVIFGVDFFELKDSFKKEVKRIKVEKIK